MKTMNEEGKQFLKDWHMLKGTHPALKGIKNLTDRFHKYRDMSNNKTMYSGLNAKFKMTPDSSGSKAYSRRSKKTQVKEDESIFTEEEINMLKACMEHEEKLYAILAAGGPLPKPSSSDEDEEVEVNPRHRSS
ncbi:hypothetical protein ACS0TY_034254 [Phlomoides rotata]